MPEEALVVESLRVLACLQTRGPVPRAYQTGASKQIGEQPFHNVIPSPRGFCTNDDHGAPGPKLATGLIYSKQQGLRT